MTIKEAMQHPDILGAGAKLRRKLPPRENFQAVLKEYKRGTLWSGSGKKVKSRQEALATAFSEMERNKKGR